tara:strand:+ start:3244 stop:4245 length:1002 start_codon:yes stop_codon:yes gene_type:complete
MNAQRSSSMFRTLTLSVLAATLVACNGSSSGATVPPAPGPTPQVNFALPSAFALEGGAPVPIRLTLDVAGSEVVTVPILIHPASSATNVFDFNLLQATATFPIGAVEATVELEILSDMECEGDEFVRLTMGVPTNATVGFQDDHDVLIDGALPELEPNDTAAEAVANGASAMLTAAPPVFEGFCGDIDEVGMVDNNDVFQFDTLDDVLVEVTLMPKDATADVSLIITSLPALPMLFVNDAGPGQAEIVSFNWAPGSDLGIIVSALAIASGTAPYELRVTAQPIPIVPLPAAITKPPTLLEVDPEIAAMHRNGATLQDMVDTLREKSLRERSGR